MNLSRLVKLKTKSKKRIGRGHGSGRGGHTSTRGTKGQKARGDVSLIFEGTKLKKSWVKRLPLLRGKGKFKPRRASGFSLDLKDLVSFKEKECVNVASLKEKGILPKNFSRKTQVKILSEGEVKVPLTIALPCSKKAAEKVKKMGGKIVEE